MKKPVRRPTAEEIAAFEETGRAIARERKFDKKSARKSRKAETRIPVNTETHEHRNTEIRDRVDAESRLSAKPDLQKHGNTASQQTGNTDSQSAVDAEIRQPVNTEMRISVPVVRLTIDLPEPVHTRFKTTCAMTKRKMVDEVRGFIEQRVAELEGEASRPL
jgi:hypothetical protein